MGIENFGVPKELVLALMPIFKSQIFVETGTFEGGTTRWAAEHFPSVVTIEGSQAVFDRVQPSFRQCHNIKSLLGTSPVELAKILPDLRRAVFWLDAHWCCGDTAGSDSECPLLAELSVIMPWFHNHIILIDDARLFLRPPPYPHDATNWPSLDDILRLTQSFAQTYTVVYKDVILIVPSVYRSTISQIMQKLP